MAVFMLGLLLISAMAGHSNAAYCVCKNGVSDAVLQKAIDYACGAGADCNPIRPNGQCFNPDTMVNHCSYAVNSYYQKKASTGATCDFNGAATLSNSNPSGGSCSFSASSGGSSTGGSSTGATSPSTGGSSTGSTPTTSPTTGSTTPVNPVSGSGSGTGTGTGMGTGMGNAPKTGTSTSPYTTTPSANTPSAGVLGGVGVGTGLGPTGSSMDDTSGASKLERKNLALIMAALLVFSSVMPLLWN